MPAAPSLPSLVPQGQPVYDLDLMRELRGRRLCQELKVLAVIGAHRFDELPLVNKLFPSLEAIYVFEPLSEPLQALHALAARDGRIRVFPVAIADRDGEAHFHVTNNDGESSSLLSLGSHREHFPEVRVAQTLTVPTRRLDSLLAENGLRAPDVMIVDVQGAELQVLGALGPALRDTLRLIYTEVSLEALYAGGGLLADVEALLAPRFANLGFAPINAQVAAHGNAVFVAQEDVSSLLELTARERVRRAYHRWKQRRRRGG
jgi:FkbM family methyltransferase